MNFFITLCRQQPKKVIVVGSICVAALIGCLIVVSNIIVDAQGQNTYSDIDSIPVKKTALLLGTNKYASNGLVNLFYIYRLQAAYSLYQEKKVSFILVSGDNGTHSYNEPEQIKEDLIEMGIPEEHIYLDYAGFRTWDSVIRANRVFLEDDFIIVSQQFHNKRALFAAKANGISAIAFNAQDVAVSRSPRVWLRERLARVNVVLDALVNTKPKFLGETIEIQ